MSMNRRRFLATAGLSALAYSASRAEAAGAPMALSPAIPAAPRKLRREVSVFISKDQF